MIFIDFNKISTQQNFCFVNFGYNNLRWTWKLGHIFKCSIVENKMAYMRHVSDCRTTTTKSVFFLCFYHPWSSYNFVNVPTQSPCQEICCNIQSLSHGILKTYRKCETHNKNSNDLKLFYCWWLLTQTAAANIKATNKGFILADDSFTLCGLAGIKPEMRFQDGNQNQVCKSFEG